jgi:serine/threonine protein kinase
MPSANGAEVEGDNRYMGDLFGGRYALGGVLGTGGMAEVRDGWDTRLERPVAVKVLHPMFTTRDDLRRRFVEEARAAAALSHPNIVAVHDFGEHAGALFIVMERLSGRTLADVMAEGPMPSGHVRAVLDQVLAALHVAHTGGVLHRDIKPANILVSPNGVKVADFGIAKTASGHQTLTGQLVGTLSYMSPERVLGSAATVSDDLYAVGMVGYEALLGRPTYPHDNPAGLVRAIVDEPLPPVAAVRRDVDPVTAGVVDRAVARSAAARFADAAQMRAALAGSPVTRRPATKVLDAPTLHVPVTVKHSPASRYAIAAGIVIAFVLAAVLLATGPFSEPPPPEPISTSTSVAPPSTTPPTTTTTTSSTPSTEQPPPPKQKKPKGEGHPGRGNGNGGPD